MALTDNIQGYWKFDESSGNASDSTANANTLTNNGTATYVAAKINNGIDLNGTTQYFSIADASQTGLDLTGAFTLAVWINTDVDPSTVNNPIITKNDNTDKNYAFAIANYGTVPAPDDRLYLSIKSTTLVEMTTTWNPTVGTWYHAAVTYTASGTNDVQFYINGAAQGAAISSGKTVLDTGGAAVEVGEIAHGLWDMWDGKIDEAGIWSRALSSSEISELYNGGTGLQYPFTVGSFRSRRMLTGSH
mgnify:CR=1 FL=1